MTEHLSPSAESIRRDLGEETFEEVRRKAGSKCYLCEDSLDLTADAVTKDQVKPGEGYFAANVYLCHLACNSLKKDLPVDAARRMIRFRKFCEARAHDVSFDDVLDNYVADPKRKAVSVALEAGVAVIRFDRGREASANVMIDPATGVSFFFCDVPIRNLHNDRDVQPRKIDWQHTWAMAQDFDIHPVHEPSSCRVELDDNGRGRLLQFDGQHKTAAQIITGRQSVPTKVYVNPSLPMIRDLIISVQNRILKLPLQAAITINKMADAYRDHWEQMGAKTEKEFVKSYRSDQQAAAKKELFSAIYKVILDDPNNKMDAFIQKQRARRGTYPLSMNNLTNLILRHLVCQEAQDVEVGSVDDLRPDEARNAVAILNELAEQLLLSQNWQFERPKGVEPSREHMKAQRFFAPGAVKYWAPAFKRALNNQLRLDLRGPEESERPLLRKLGTEQHDLIQQTLRRLVEHPIWTDDTFLGIDGALGENRPARSVKLFTKDYPIPLDPAYMVGLKS